jgi:predicted nuclease of predicted toxin-antitoxin system
LRVLCDANIGSRLATLLTDAGHDVIRSIHVLRHDSPDSEVLAQAVSDARILVTCDADFGELVFLRGAQPPPAIIFVRFEPEEVEEIAPRVLAVLGWPNLAGHMAVIGQSSDRLTAFPEES